MSRSDIWPVNMVLGGISATIETVRNFQLELCYDLVNWEKIIKSLLARVF